MESCLSVKMSVASYLGNHLSGTVVSCYVMMSVVCESVGPDAETAEMYYN